MNSVKSWLCWARSVGTAGAAEVSTFFDGDDGPEPARRRGDDVEVTAVDDAGGLVDEMAVPLPALLRVAPRAGRGDMGLGETLRALAAELLVGAS